METIRNNRGTDIYLPRFIEYLGDLGTLTEREGDVCIIHTYTRSYMHISGEHVKSVSSSMEGKDWRLGEEEDLFFIT